MIGRMIAAAFLGVIGLGSSLAHAGDGGARLSIDWGKLFARPEWAQLHKRPSVVAAVDALHTRVLTEESMPWFGSAIHVAILARDWQGAQRLLGSHLCATDALRVSRSSRMVVTRFILSDGRIAPFAQLGLGQWRLDPELLPIFRSDTELAGQIGVGVDIPIAPHAGVAFETDYTVLYREAHEQHVASPRVWSTLAVARMEL